MFHKDVRAALVATAAVALSLVSVYARQQPAPSGPGQQAAPAGAQPPATPAAGARGGGAGRGGPRGAAPLDPDDHTGFEQIFDGMS